MKLKFMSIVALLVSNYAVANELLDQYNIVWDSPSKSSIESMPVGGHSIGCNVWVEDGDILFYAQRSGSFTENNEYHKLGRFRVSLTPNPFDGYDSFTQELKLNEGYVEISGKKGDATTTVSLWIEALRPVIHLDVESSNSIETEVIYENWRDKISHIETEINYGPAFGCFSWMNYPGKIYRYPDMVDYEDDAILFYHRNRNDKLLINYSIKQQGLEECSDKIVNTQVDRTFGGIVKGEGFVRGVKSDGEYIWCGA